MIKKITAKIKSILGRKPRVAKTKNVVAAKGNKRPQSKTSTAPSEKGRVIEKRKKPFKKETPEEYRARHEKRAKNKPTETTSRPNKK